MTDHPSVPTDRRALLAGIGGLAAGTFLSAGRAEAGPLNPPAAPAPTPGPEPRIAVSELNTPGDAQSTFLITEPGSYYLAGNVQGQSGKHGIVINTSGVTLDLNGFEVIGPEDGGAFDGVSVRIANQRNIVVMNGMTRLWGGNGVNLASGFVRFSRIENVVSGNNGLDGIRAGVGNIVHRCVGSENGSVGINVSSGCAITNCIASNNAAAGIGLGERGRAIDCLVLSNGIYGIFAVFGNTVIRGNNCHSNGPENDEGSGISVSSRRNLIEGNLCEANRVGIRCSNISNLILRNFCSTNTTNYDIVSGNVCLVVNASTSGAINGNSGGVSPGSSNPNANYSY